ncbi:MAG TPA: hypothetical protein VGY55_07375 [Pirellulales bacterium]|jgi:hypothetical protein|nr:hypothetical protein [Pirellulales bacterium]
MRIRSYATSAIACSILLAVAFAWNMIGPDADANPPWQIFMVKKVDADPSKAYALSDANGPWMIMATTFRGEKAGEQASQMVFELRKHYKLNAYTHRQTYDYTKEVQGVGVNPDGTPKNMHYANREKFEEVAVLVGDYRGIDDPEGQRNLAMLKHAEPDCLKTSSAKGSGNSFAELRRMSQQMFTGGTMKSGGPLASAFMTTNPLLPKEYFAPKAGIDKFVLDLNKGNDYSLLDCKGRFSVKIATFTGKIVIDQRKITDIEHGKDIMPHDKVDETDPLVYATKKAHALTEALRKTGVEAYEFHDRYSSIVTVGSFNSVGTPRSDGKTEINPNIYEIMRTYGPDPKAMVADGGAGGLGQKSIAVTIDKEKKSVLLDVQPVPVEVPRRSISTDYQQTSLFR